MRLEEMTDAQLDELVATRIMGLSLEPDEYPEHKFSMEDYPDYSCDRCYVPMFEGNVRINTTGPCFEAKYVPNYTTDLNATAKMEAELYRLNLHVAYVKELSNIIAKEGVTVTDVDIEIHAYSGWEGPNYLFAMVTATPRQGVLAALKACGVEQQ